MKPLPCGCSGFRKNLHRHRFCLHEAYKLIGWQTLKITQTSNYKIGRNGM